MPGRGLALTQKRIEAAMAEAGLNRCPAGGSR